MPRFRNRRPPTSGGFTFIELMVVVLLMAGLVLIGLPKFQEARKRQNASASGQNLKIINTAIVQWGIENFGPPNADASAQTLDSIQVVLPASGASDFCIAMEEYIQGVTWYSPSRPGTDTYVYATWDFNDILYSSVFSVLDSNLNYEPSGYENRNVSTPSGHTFKASYANGYEDFGSWTDGSPRVNGLDPLGQSIENYP